MVEMSASVSNAEMSGLQSSLLKYGEALGGNMKTATKVTALTLCDSLRKRTRKAPPKARSGEYSAEVSRNPPPYITYRRGIKLATPLHRWSLTRKLNTPDQYTKDHYVYVHTKELKSGKIRQDKAAELRELKKYHLGVFHAGLAKASWGWVKKDIAGHGGDAVWKKRKRDHRNPRDSVRGMFEAIKGALTEEATARLKNYLDYIESALQSGALQESVTAVEKSLAWKILDLEAKARSSAKL